MAKTINPSGFRSVTPGKCYECGESDGWNSDGHGTVYCECQTCPDCGMFDGHEIGCPMAETLQIRQESA